MRFLFAAAIGLLFLTCQQPGVIYAQDDLAAKAQNERELSLYGTGSVASSINLSSPSDAVIPFIKTQYSRTTGEALTSKILREVQARPARRRRGSHQQLHTPNLHESEISLPRTRRRAREIFRRDSSTNRVIGWDFIWSLTQSLTIRSWYQSERPEVIR
jgi:hypothetical protein